MAAAAKAEAKTFEDSLGRHRRRLAAREERVVQLKQALRSTRVSLHSLRSEASRGGSHSRHSLGGSAPPGRFEDDASSVGSFTSSHSALDDSGGHHASAVHNATPRSVNVTGESVASAPARARGGVAFAPTSGRRTQRTPVQHTHSSVPTGLRAAPLQATTVHEPSPPKPHQVQEGDTPSSKKSTG